MLKSGIVNMHSDIKKLDLTILPKPTMREGLKTRRSYVYCIWTHRPATCTGSTSRGASVNTIKDDPKPSQTLPSSTLTPISAAQRRQATFFEDPVGSDEGATTFEPKKAVRSTRWG